MTARFGRVLYWAACGIAAIFWIFAAFALGLMPPALVIAAERQWPEIAGLLPNAVDIKGGIALTVIAGVIWLIGRALQYVLANE